LRLEIARFISQSKNLSHKKPQGMPAPQVIIRQQGRVEEEGAPCFDSECGVEQRRANNRGFCVRLASQVGLCSGDLRQGRLEKEEP